MKLYIGNKKYSSWSFRPWIAMRSKNIEFEEPIEEQSSESRVFKFNWYPGHIAKAEKQLREKISLIDMIIELVDARIPVSSSHAGLAQWAGVKPIIRVLSKSDIADQTKNPRGIRVNGKERKNIGSVIREIEEAAKPINERYKKKGVSITFRVSLSLPISLCLTSQMIIVKSSSCHSVPKLQEILITMPGRITACASEHPNKSF